MQGREGFVSEHHDTYPDITPAQWHLEGKVVLVTGASRGIGRAIALSFAKARASGIAIAARSTKDLEELEAAIAKVTVSHEDKTRVLRLECDVTDVASVEKAEKSVKGTFGRLDILVNNAGISERLAQMVESEPDEWWKTWTVNMRGPYLVTRAFLPLLLESKDGDKTIVNLSSIGAHQMLKGASAYQVSIGNKAICRYDLRINYNSPSIRQQN